MHNSALARRIEDNSIPEPNSGCWIWLGAVSDGGTKHERAKAHFDGAARSAARAAYAAYRGDIPAGHCVLHTCDTPLCVNPDHLWTGTHLDNVRDMDRKGRRVVRNVSRGNGRGGVYPTPSGRFRAQISKRGTITHVGTFDTEADARVALAKLAS